MVSWLTSCDDFTSEVSVDGRGEPDGEDGRGETDGLEAIKICGWSWSATLGSVLMTTAEWLATIPLGTFRKD